MGVEHLVGKRSGRPKGSKSRPPWVRDLLWAYRNLGKPDAVPPSPLAAGLAALGRERPEQLVACLALADGLGRQGQAADPGERTDGKPGDGAVPPPPEAPTEPPHGLQRVSVPGEDLIAYLRGAPLSWVRSVPHVFEVVGLSLENCGLERRAVLTIRSPRLPPAADGEPIPELKVEYAQ
jgi:hypothetical protein